MPTFPDQLGRPTPDRVYTGAAIQVEIAGVQVSIAVSHPPTPSQAVFSINVEDQPKKAHGLGAPEPDSPVRRARDDYSPL